MPTLAELSVDIKANLTPFNNTMKQAEQQILAFQKKLNQAGSGMGSAFSVSALNDFNKDMKGTLNTLDKLNSFDLTRLGVEFLEVSDVLKLVKKDISGLDTNLGKLSKKRLDNLSSIKNDLIEVITPLERFIDSINATKQINNPFKEIQKDIKSLRTSLAYLANIKVGDRLSNNFEKIQRAAAYLNPIIAQLEHNFKSLASLQFPDMTKLALQLNTIATAIKKISENLNKVQGEQRFARLASNLERLKVAATGLASPLHEVADALNKIKSPDISGFGSIFHQLRDDIRALRTDMARLQTYSRHTNSARTSAASFGALGGAELSSSAKNSRYLSIGGPSILTGTLAGVATGISVHQLQQYADSYTNLQNRLATTASLTGTYVASLDDLRKAANDSNASIEATANLYARLAFSGSKFLKSEEEVMALTTTLQKGLALSGATAAETNSAITQFTQSLAAGRLNGDELRSLVENAPILINAIAKEFGVNPGDLKDMGARGELDIRRVLKAILAVTGDINQAFAKMDKSIEATFQTLRNNFIMWIGRSDDVVSATEKINAVLMGIANNIDAVATGAAAAAAVLLTMSAPMLAAAIINPWVGLPVLIGAATGLLYKYGDEINVLESQSGTLNDAFTIVFRDLKTNAEDAIEKVKPMFTDLVESINGDLANINWEDVLNDGYSYFQEFLIRTKYEFVIFSQILTSTVQFVIDSVRKITGASDESIKTFFSTVGSSLYKALNPLGAVLDLISSTTENQVKNGNISSDSPYARAIAERDAEIEKLRNGRTASQRLIAQHAQSAYEDAGTNLDSYGNVNQLADFAFEQQGMLNPLSSTVEKVDAAFEMLSKETLTTADNFKTMMGLIKEEVDKSAGFGGSIPQDAYKYLLSRKASNLPDEAITKLTTPTAEAVAKWLQALEKAGIDAGKITSGYRGNEKQAELRKAYLNGTGPLAAPPGKSTHRLGTTVDVMGLNNLSPEEYAIAVGLAQEQGIKFPVKSEKWHATYYGENAKYIKNTTTGNSRQEPQFENDFERQIFNTEDDIKRLNDQYDVLQNLNPLIDDYGYNLAYSETRRKLLSEAEKEGLSLSPEQLQAVDELAKKYANASANVNKLAQEQQLANQRVEDLRNTSKDVFGGFIKDMKNGESAAEALANALDKIADKLLDLSLNYIFDSASSGGSGIFDSLFQSGGKIIGSLFGSASGGYTGNVPTDQVTGWHHGQEYVLNANATKSIGVSNLDRMNATGSIPTIAVPNYQINKSQVQTVHVVLDAQTDPSVIMQISDGQIKKAAPGIVTTSVIQSQKTTRRNMASMITETQNKEM